jgi:hypothetical protein
MRACGLIRRAATATSPVASQAQALAETLSGQSGLAFEQCMRASLRGWGEPAWTTFTLSRDHRVRIARDGFGVEYEGASKRTPEVGVAPAGYSCPSD